MFFMYCRQQPQYATQATSSKTLWSVYKQCTRSLSMLLAQHNKQSGKSTRQQSKSVIVFVKVAGSIDIALASLKIFGTQQNPHSISHSYPQCSLYHCSVTEITTQLLVVQEFCFSQVKDETTHALLQDHVERYFWAFMSSSRQQCCFCRFLEEDSISGTVRGPITGTTPKWPNGEVKDVQHIAPGEAF